MSEKERLDPNLWVDRHGDLLYRYALLRVRSAEAAAEVLQETFLEALKARHQFQARSSERTWLVGILKHKIVDHLRRKSQRSAATPDSTAHSDKAYFHRGRWIKSPSPLEDDPAADFERDEFWQAFGRCLQRLPAHLADAFLLRELEEVDSQEICKIMKITPTNLWARLHRARLALRACLEKYWLREQESHS